jgi:hypothetical protein
MIALLRSGAFLTNVALTFGLPLVLGLSWPWALLVSLCFFACMWWACGHAPRASEADEEARRAGERAAKLMEAPPPRYVRKVDGWTAAAVRSGNGYGLVLGEDVAVSHREAILGHEIAHYTSGDLFWEPFTDGPARILLSAVRRIPLLGIPLFPFFLFGAPLARLTELRADTLAARRIPLYPVVLKEVAREIGGPSSLLYPSLTARVRRSARDSLQSG